MPISNLFLTCISPLQGERKQLEWIENLRALTSDPSVSIEGDVRDLLGQVMEHENIPRKRAKFANFVKNIRRGVRPATIDKTWELFEQALKKKSPLEAKEEKPDESSKKSEDTSVNPEETTNGNAAEDEEGKSKKKKGKKRKVQEEEEAPENGVEGSGSGAEEKRGGIKMFKGTKKTKKKDKSKNHEKEANGKLSEDRNETEAEMEKSEKSKKKKGKKRKKEDDVCEPSMVTYLVTDGYGCSETITHTKSKKRKKEDAERNNADAEEGEQSPRKKSKKAEFDWEEVIAELLTKKGGKMKANKLKKKVVGECVSRGAGGNKSEEQLMVKFDKRMTQSRRFKVQEDFVSLVDEDQKENTVAAATDNKEIAEEKKPEISNGDATVEGKSKKKKGKKRKKQEEEALAPENGVATTAFVIDKTPRGKLPAGVIVPEKVAPNSPFSRPSFNKWEKASLGGDTEKFQRLMGMKKSGATTPTAAEANGNDDDDNPSAVKSAEKTEAMFKAQEEHFEKARGMIKSRGKGLGFAS